MQSTYDKIKKCQEQLIKLSYPITNSKSYYKNYEDQLNNMENDVKQYKLYEDKLESLINIFEKHCNENNYKIHRFVYKTIHKQIEFIDIDKYSKMFSFIY